MNINFALVSAVLSVIALLATLYCFWKLWTFTSLKKTFFAGSHALDLESVILSLKAELESSQRQQHILENTLAELEHKTAFAIQKVGLVRFNPFSDGGGNFSFSLALLDSHNTGIILTSMHGREQNRIYTKKIDTGKCEIQLTQEEQQAVIVANNKYLSN